MNELKSWGIQRLVSSLLVVAISAILGDACGASQRVATPHQHTLRLSTYEFTGLSAASAVQGTLTAQANSDGSACTWIGSETNRIGLIWPNGYTATDSPIVVYDTHGRLVAAVGEPYQFVGGQQPASLGNQLFGCPTLDLVWVVGAVNPIRH